MSSVSGRQKKEIKFRGVSVRLVDLGSAELEVAAEGEEGAQGCPVVSGGIEREDYLSVTCPPIATSSASTQPYNVFLGMQALRVAVSPQQLVAIAEVLSPWLEGDRSNTKFNARDVGNS